VSYLCDTLRQGHEFPGMFTSTHVHVAAGGLPVYTLKNLLRLWRFFEAPMFRLSCGELGIHRGVTRKEYAYCRPLSAPPIIFDQNRHMRPAFDVGSLLKATNLREFFMGYGANDPQREPIRYHPARYVAFNLLPLLTIGTVEFRTFNETTNPQYIRAWVEIAKAFVTAAFTTKGLSDDDYPQLPLGYNGTFDLGTMQTLLELPDETMFTVARLWDTADWCPFDGLPLFHSNNENLTLNFRDESAVTMPPVIDGTSVMMYAPTGSGRSSEDRVYVFHNYSSYASATRSNPVPVEEGRDLVRANFRQTEESPAVVSQPESREEFTRTDRLRDEVERTRQRILANYAAEPANLTPTLSASSTEAQQGMTTEWAAPVWQSLSSSQPIMELPGSSWLEEPWPTDVPLEPDIDEDDDEEEQPDEDDEDGDDV